MSHRSILLILVIALLPARLMHAQMDGGAASSPATIVLSPSVMPDPFFITLIAGGMRPANDLDADCMGFIPDQPSLLLEISEMTGVVHLFFYSEHDSVMMLQQPDGTYRCTDDFSESRLDGALSINSPAAGQYTLWLGSYHQNQQIPGFLVMTRDVAVTPETLDLGAYVTRESQIKTDYVQLPAGQSPNTQASYEAGSNSVQESVTGGGSQIAAALGGPTCNGFISTDPGYAFTVSTHLANLRVFFEGDQDSTLLVQLPDGSYRCSDDSQNGANLNPVIDLPVTTPGVYRIFVGTLTPDTTVTGQITLTENPAILPDVLAAP